MLLFPLVLVPLQEFSMQMHKAITGVAKGFNGYTRDECAYKCLHHKAFFCKAFNYYTGTGGDDSVCTLSTMNGADVEPIYDPQQDYYERNQTYGKYWRTGAAPGGGGAFLKGCSTLKL